MPVVNHELLRSRRDELDLSNGDLARLLEISDTYLRNIVSGVDNPSMRIVHRFARALDLSVEDIVAADSKRQGTEKTKGPKRAVA